MKQHYEGVHENDADGNPAGGHSWATGIEVNWQNGPLNVDGVRVEPTGAFVETMIAITIDRIEYYQTSKFACSENAIALDHLYAALQILNQRTRSRERRGIEGQHIV
jgi:hypothetical protein